MNPLRSTAAQPEQEPAWESWRFHKQFMDAVLYSGMHRLPTMGASALGERMHQWGNSGGGESAIGEMFERAAHYQRSHVQEGVKVRDAGRGIMAQPPEYENRRQRSGNGTRLKVYLSAGEGTTTCVPGPDAYAIGCDIYELSLRITDGVGQKIVEVEENRVVVQHGDVGSVQPAIDPSGQRLAYLTKDLSTSEVRVRKLSDGSDGFIKSGTDRDDNRPEFPNWYSDDILLHHSGVSGEKTIFANEISGIVSDREVAMLGSVGAFQTNRTFQDPNTARDGTSRIVSFGKALDGDGANMYPVVHDLFGFDIETSVMANGELNSAISIGACHHPAWNPSGTKVSCSEQDSVEGVSGIGYRPLYDLERRSNDNASGGLWVQDGLSVPLNVPPNLPPPFNSLQAGEILVMKYAEWCGFENMMIVTIFSAVGEIANKSRVFLAIYNSNDVYSQLFNEFKNPDKIQWVDLTELVLPNQAVSGVYGTCYREDS